MKKLFVMIAVGLLSTPAVAQRDLGARRIVLYNGMLPEYKLTLEASSLMTGDATFTFPPSGGSMPEAGTLDGQTLRWNNTSSYWEPSSRLLNTGTRLGINVLSPQAFIHSRDTQTVPFASHYHQMYTDGAGVSGPGFYHGYYEARAFGSDVFGTSAIIGLSGRVVAERTLANVVPEGIGVLGSIDHVNDGTITNARAVVGQIYNSDLSSGPISTASAFNAVMTNSSSIGTLNGLWIQAPLGAGTMSNFNGIKIGQVPSATTNLIFNYDHSTDPLTINADGKLTIGAAASTFGDRLEVRSNSTATSSVHGTYGELVLAPSGATTDNSYGLSYQATAEDGGTMNTRSLTGIAGRALANRSAGSILQVIGTLGAASTVSSASHSASIGVYGEVVTLGTGTITNASSVLGRIFPGGGTITNGAAIHAAQGSPFGGSIENNYGLLIDPISMGTVSNTALLYDHATTPFIVTGAGEVGVGTDDPNTTLDIDGALALRHYGDVNLGAGATHYHLGTTTGASYITINADAAGSNWAGFGPLGDGQIMIVYSSGSGPLTIINESATPPATSRIRTMTGGDIATTGEASFTFIYNEGIQRWILLSVQD